MHPNIALLGTMFDTILGANDGRISAVDVGREIADHTRRVGAVTVAGIEELIDHAGYLLATCYGCSEANQRHLFREASILARDITLAYIARVRETAPARSSAN